MNDIQPHDAESDEPRAAAAPADDTFQAVLARLFGPKPDEPIADWLVAAPSRQRRLAALALGGLVLYGGVAGSVAWASPTTLLQAIEPSAPSASRTRSEQRSIRETDRTAGDGDP